MSLKLAAAQINLWVGDIPGNVDRMVAAAAAARDEHGADLVVFPELSLIGYPPDDLLLRSGMPAAVAAGVARLEQEIRGIRAVVGLPEFDGERIYNAAFVVGDGATHARYRKQCLPSYGVFDEHRHYTAGDRACVVDIAGTRVGLSICEDIWFEAPARRAAEAGAELLVNINASPFDTGKSAQRERTLATRARETGLPIVYVNCVGGQDELVFDGDSRAVDGQGRTRFRAEAFRERVYAVDLDGEPSAAAAGSDADPVARTYRGLVTAIRDYGDRNGFPGAVLGLSGGIDSALVAALACDALGPERVWTVSLPSRYTAGMSNDDAQEQAELLGCRYDRIPIEPSVAAVSESLSGLFAGREPNLTEENLQSRCRGLMLMALSNKFGHLLLATGNKSEMAVGYATLYGDMAGGFAPIKDVYKTTVYELARYRNDIGRVIPERVITRPPSAELRDDQQDSDSLPDYALLDAVLSAYVEEQCSIDQIVARGYDAAEVRRIAALVRRSEYKRRQAPPGPKITARAFGRDRRYPITAVYGDL